MHPDILAAVDIGKIYITNNTQGIGDTVDAVGHARRFSLTELGGVLNGPVYENTNADLGTFPVEDRVEGPMASFQVTLNELQRVTALRFSNTSGGDGTAVWVELDAGAIMDLSLNTNALQYAVPMEEIPDTTPPAISTTATLDYSTGTLSVAFSETVAASKGTGVGGVDVSKIYLSNNAGDLNFNILGATVPSVDLLSFDIALTEPNRALAIALSNTPGGDGVALNVETLALAFYDVAGNPNPVRVVSPLTEVPDTVPPVPLTASIDFGTGVVVVNASETIDSTPLADGMALVLLDRLFLSQQVNGRDVALGGGPSTFPLDEQTTRVDNVHVVAHDTTRVVITLTEAMRVDALALSNSAGLNGNQAGTNIILDLLQGAVVDVATNLNAQNIGLSMVEIPDSVPPTVLNASINYGTGLLEVYFSEAIDATFQAGMPGVVDRTKMVLHESDEDSLPGLPGLIDVSQGDLNARDNSVVAMTLDEHTRVVALRTSGTLGGDGARPNYLAVAAGAVVDLYNNPNVGHPVPFPLMETPDTIVPTVTSIVLDLHTGNLTLHMSETIDVTPPQGTCHDSSTWLDPAVSYGCPGAWLLDDSALIELIETPGSRLNMIKLKSANPNTGQHLGVPVQHEGDRTIVRLVLDEAARVQAVLQSGTTGGDGDALHLTIGRFFAHDLARNWLVSQDHVDLTVQEIADTVPPTVVAVDVRLEDGTVTITLHETLRLVPNTLLNQSLLFFGNSSLPSLDNGAWTDSSGRNTSAKVSLASATLADPGSNSPALVLTLPEEERAKYIAQSGTPGGDGSAMTFEMLPGAVQDMSFNPNALQLNAKVVEHPDALRPSILQARLHLSNGTLVLTCSETIDVTPQTTQVTPRHIFLHDQALNWNGYTANGALDYAESMYNNEDLHHFTLEGAQVVPEIDGATVTLVLTESQRARAIAISNTQGGDSTVVLCTVKAGAVKDVAGNDNLIASDMTVSEHDDLLFPSLLSAEMFMGNGTLIVTMDEYIDLTETGTKVKFQHMYIGNFTGDRSYTTLAGSTAVAVDDYHVTITVPEAVRVKAIESSQTPGGDGHAGYYVMDAGAVVDVAQNPNPSHEGVVIQVQ